MEKKLYLVELAEIEVEQHKLYFPNTNIKLFEEVGSNSEPVEDNVELLEEVVELESVVEENAVDLSDYEALKEKLAHYEKYDGLIDLVNQLGSQDNTSLVEELNELKAYKEKVKAFFSE